MPVMGEPKTRKQQLISQMNGIQARLERFDVTEDEKNRARIRLEKAQKELRDLLNQPSSA